MTIPLAIGIFIVGLALVIYFAEKMVAGVVGTAAGFGLSGYGYFQIGSAAGAAEVQQP